MYPLRFLYMALHRTMHLLSTHVHSIVSSYMVDSTGSGRFHSVLILPPLLVVLACQGNFNEDHFRCQQPHCGCSPAASLTGRVLFALWQPLSFTFPQKDCKFYDLFFVKRGKVGLRSHHRPGTPLTVLHGVDTSRYGGVPWGF